MGGAVVKGANGSRGRRPKPGLRGVRVRWSKRADAWTFRAALTVDGKRVHGPQRLTAEAAHEDYQRMRSTAEGLLPAATTIGKALDRVIQNARRRGVPAETIRKSYQAHGAYLLRWWRPEGRVAALTLDELTWFVQAAQEQGRHPNTLLTKDLPLIGRIQRAAGLPNLVPELRERLRQTLKRVPPRMAFFTAGELAELLERMRSGTFRRTGLACRGADGCGHAWTGTLEDRPGVDQPKRCPACGRRFTVRSRARGRALALRDREHDAGVVELLALTGIRSGELSRITLGDFDDARGTVSIVAKDRGHPRDVELVGRIGPLFQRLRDAAHARSGGGLDARIWPGGMDALSALCARWKDRLSEPRLSGRTLRHSFVTGLLHSGTSAGEARGLAGHRLLATTDRYVHEVSEGRAVALQGWQDRLRADGGRR